MSNKTYKTYFPFVVSGDGKIGSTEFALVEVISSKQKTSEEFLKDLKKLVTKWVKGDPQGRMAYGANDNHFNIGDLALYEKVFGRWIPHSELTKLGLINITIVYCEDTLGEPINFNAELVE